MPRLNVVMASLGLATVACWTSAGAHGACAPVSEADVASWHEKWVASLETRHPDRVMRNYATDSTMIGLDANDMRSGFLEIRDHYVYFLQREPDAKVDSRAVRTGCNTASDVGIQTMTLRAKANAPVETIKVRYTLNYEFRDEVWRIVHHHLSAMPISVPAKPPAVAGFVRRTDPKTAPTRPSSSSGSQSAATAAAMPAMTYRPAPWTDSPSLSTTH